jgi:hypothetical protein
MSGGFHSSFYNNPYNNESHTYQPQHVTMFSGLKKKLSRRSSNHITDTNAVHSAKSMDSRSVGLTPPHHSSPLSSASPATRRPSKHCRKCAILLAYRDKPLTHNSQLQHESSQSSGRSAPSLHSRTSFAFASNHGHAKIRFHCR